MGERTPNTYFKAQASDDNIVWMLKYCIICDKIKT